MAPTPGILYVNMQPKPGLPDSQFHDWYNNEHGPTRLQQLPFVTNGFRYRANDLDDTGPRPLETKPEWMAIYDITDMEELTKESYLRLRGAPVKTQREADTMAQISVDRKVFDLLETWESKEFKRLEDVGSEGQGNIIVAVLFGLYPGELAKAELGRWYKEEHVDLLSKVPGWRRTRRYVTSSIDPNAPVEYLALHEYAPENGLGGPGFIAATTTPRTHEIMSKVVKEKQRRVYSLSYTFGPAPRYLAPNLSEWSSTDPSSPYPTKIFPTSSVGADSGAIESFITTPDGVVLPYRLEGSSSPDAPLIVLCNSILVTWGIWDAFLASFFASPSNKKYRILRYLKRGRYSSCGEAPVTVDLLSSDIIALLDALRVKKAAAIIGVSLGGGTALNTALKYSERVGSFVSCDTSSKSPAGNAKAWGDRIAVAEKESAIDAASGENIVGQDLAELTVRRWFVRGSYDGNGMEKRIGEVKNMVATNSLEGFKKSVRALFEYDMKAEMVTSVVKGMFVVGGEDGALPGAMKDMAAAYGQSGARFEVIENAGHLPMVENPQNFARVVLSFLSAAEGVGAI